MDVFSEKMVFRNESFISESPPEEVDEELGEYLEDLEDEMYGVEAVEVNDEIATFSSSGSEVSVSYELREFEEYTGVDMSFAGAAPLVDRFSNYFSEDWANGELSHI